MRKFYLYRHIRLDKNEVFYIGIGTKPKVFSTVSREYNRAHTKSKRNPIWNSIVDKTEYEVEILIESENKEFIKEKEKEFIEIYGRKNNRNGTLANITAGGDGSLDVIVSNNTRIKMSKASSKKIRRLASERLSKKCIHTSTGREFKSLKEGCKVMKESYGAQKMAILHKRSTARFMFVGEEFLPKKRKRYQARNCVFINTGEVFKSLRQGCLTKGVKYSQQQDAIKLNLTTKLFNWADDEI